MTAFPTDTRRRYTLAEYLEFEETAPTKHEFHNGEILAIVSTVPEPATASLIATGIFAALTARRRRSDR